MQLEIGMVGIKAEIVGIIGVGMNPNRILSPFEHTAQDSGHRTRSQLRVGNRKHIGLEAGMTDIPIKEFGTPLGIKPSLIQVLCLRRSRQIETTRTIIVGGLLRQHDRLFASIRPVRSHSLLEMFPHIEHNAPMIPPIDVMSLGLSQIGFPSHNMFQFFGLKSSSMTSISALSRSIWSVQSTSSK